MRSAEVQKAIHDAAVAGTTERRARRLRAEVLTSGFRELAERESRWVEDWTAFALFNRGDANGRVVGNVVDLPTLRDHRSTILALQAESTELIAERGRIYKEILELAGGFE